MEEVVRLKTLKGYAQVKIAGMKYHYKSGDGQRLPNPKPGCPVSLQLEPSNPYHDNAIKVINELDSRHLGYVVRETADALAPLLRDGPFFASTRGIISVPPHFYATRDVITCLVLFFSAVPRELIPPLPPQLNFNEDLSSPFFLADTPVASPSCTLEDFDAYFAPLIARLRKLSGPDQLPPPQIQLPRDTSTLSDGEAEAISGHNRASDQGMETQTNDPSPPAETQIQVLAAERNETTCMKCKQTGGGPFFQCARSGCPLLIHESCSIGVVRYVCIFCLFLVCRAFRLRAKKSSHSHTILEEHYDEARRNAIEFLGKDTFMRLLELAGLDPILTTQVQAQVPCNVSIQCDTEEGREGEAVGTSKIVEESAAKEKKEKMKDAAGSCREEKQKEKEVAGHGKRRLPPRSCKNRTPSPAQPFSEKPIYIGRRRNLPFTEEEERLLKQGVEKYAKDGMVSWIDILKYGETVFHKSRTAIDLKDKWRNMMKKKKTR